MLVESRDRSDGHRKTTHVVPTGVWQSPDGTFISCQQLF